ncbi:hypothetical protein Q5P01_013055 [Channa striata]|uniref:Laminin subunit beta-4-like n=1 Tax=Channa striata TaxID=64152 RepID=A0AA88MQY6_CHASR|nr:hypothetical protein Q5P01_013055 [Channa striata]
MGDLMVGRAARLSASSTCGLEGPENYCIIGPLEEQQKCFMCDSQLPFDHPNSHRIDNVITTLNPDRKPKWWQSENGVHQVSIQLDLETVFQFSHLVLTFKSVRPAAMLVERSKDFGQTWNVLRYFAEDCLLHFPSVSTKPADGLDEVVCDSRYSGSEPSSNGEVVLKALDPIFDRKNTASFRNLNTLTNLRVNFTRLFTLGDTLPSLRGRNPRDKYFYALYSMVVRGSCFCNGHASECTPVDGGRGDVFHPTGMVHGHCVCRHNTAGESCEQCADFHHDSPWRPGAGDTADICRRCNCHGHSDSCHFDDLRFEVTGGRSGGVCDNCGHNRTGPQCERCGPFLYQDPERARDDPHACLPCYCDPAGSKGGGLCNALTGQCACKENVEGRRCDFCKRGFFGLRQDNPAGCQVCKCHVLGSVKCDRLTGSCECDRFTVGPFCDQCQAGFWGLGNSVHRCSPCDCDIGGALSTRCSQEDGQCHCLPHMTGRRCSDPAPGHFLPALNIFLYEAELAALLPGKSLTSSPPAPLPSPQFNSGLPRCEQYFRDQGFDFKFSDGRVHLLQKTRQLAHRRRHGQTSVPLDPGHTLQIVPQHRTAKQPITWTGPGLLRVSEGAGLRFSVDNLQSLVEFKLVIRYEVESSSDWLALVSIITLLPGNGGCSREPTRNKSLILPGTSRVSVLDSAVCLNSGGRYYVDIIFKKKSESVGSHILIDSMGLVPSTESRHAFCSQSELDSIHHFHCVGLTADLNPQESRAEICEGLVKSLSARIHNGALRCSCNVLGSLSLSCSKLGGVCECKLNVIGRCCDTCAPLTFGFGPDGCKLCECDPRGSLTELCDQVRGQCVCRSKVAGRRCNHCQIGFWGFPACRSCDCNGWSEDCDDETGECLECTEHTAGPHCNRCVDGFYGDPVSRQPCQPCLCPDSKSSGRFFATSCQYSPESLSLTCNCREGHTGPQCDRCSPGFYGNLTSSGARCEQCSCNDNIDPDDRNACDELTGECLCCNHHTMGSRCQTCEPGYYGNALDHDCKECSCDQRGTEVAQCPLGSPCLCDPITGQCPCRRGVRGFLCDECEDGFWNLDGALGCRLCSCDPLKSVSNICNKVTGQCPCRPEFGGRWCDECGENHFGNPNLQCISCDCNPEGTEHPSCDPESGKCKCRTGITGISCDKCAPGYDSAFPVCKQCHPCSTVWARTVTDVQRATKRMKTFIPHHSIDLPPKDYWKRLLDMYLKLYGLYNLTGLCPLKVEKVENLFVRIRKVKNTINLNVILMDLSPLLNTDIENIMLEFKKLLRKLQGKFVKDVDEEEENLQGLLDHIKKLHNGFMMDDWRLRNASKALEDSMDTRQDVKHKLSMCRYRGDLESMEKKMLLLRVVDLNTQICGGPGLDYCSGSGGALRNLDLGKSKFGGLNFNGVVPISQKTAETAERSKEQLITLLFSLDESSDVKQTAQDTKDQARDLQDRIINSMDTFKKEKKKTEELAEQVRAYLMDEMVPAEDIIKMSRAVLAIHLPQSPDQIRSTISDISILLSSATNLQKSLGSWKANVDHTGPSAESSRAQRTKAINMTDISRDTVEGGQDKANIEFESAGRDTKTTTDRIHDIKDKLHKTGLKLMNRPPEDLQRDIKALRSKMVQNREKARHAQQAAELALNMAAEMESDLDDVMKQYGVLIQNKQNQTFRERLENISNEVEAMRTQLENKLTQILGLEQRIQQLINRKVQKSGEVSSLLEIAESLHREISRKADGFANCAS